MIEQPILPNDTMQYTFTAVYVAGEEDGYVAYAEELPGALGQGHTIEEARESLREALELVVGSNRQISRDAFRGARVVLREILSVGR
jgi:predicted RNase H-like HicB family nuclease